MIEFMYQRPAVAHRHYMNIVETQLKIPAFKSVMRQNVSIFGHKSANVVPAVLLLKPYDQIRGELMELVSEFQSLFDSPKGGVAAA
jgi:hypothetical protein